LHRAYENVDHEDDLGAVVPLHVPIVVRRDYKPRDLLILGHFLVALINHVVLGSLIHLKDGVTTHRRHHSNYFDFLPYNGPVLFGFIGFNLFLILLG
jgi:hypothetical protein